MDQEGNLVELERTTVEKDLGVQFNDALKFSMHIEMQVNTANKIVALIRRSLTQLDREYVRTMYKTLMRPNIEHRHSVTCRRYEKDGYLMEGVQRHTISVITELKQLHFETRLKSSEAAITSVSKKIAKTCLSAACSLPTCTNLRTPL